MQRRVGPRRARLASCRCRRPGTSGMETGLVEPGRARRDGRSWGTPASSAAASQRSPARCGAEVVEVERATGASTSRTRRLLDALDDHPDARLLVVVHAETSTGSAAPAGGARRRAARSRHAAHGRLRHLARRHRAVLRRLGDRLRLLVHAEVRSARLPACPRSRSRPRAGAHRASATVPVPVLDGPPAAARLLGRASAHLPPHRADPPHLRAARGAAPGPRRRASKRAGRATPRPGATSSRRSAPRGFDLLADPDHQLAPAHRRPRARGRRRKRACSGACSPTTGIEVGGGLGPDAPPMWRIGLMGPNASPRVADRVLAALDSVLADEPVAAAPR